MKVRVKKTVRIKGEQYTAGNEHDVDSDLGRWMVDKDIAEEVSPANATAILNRQVTYEPAYNKLMNLAEGHLAEIYGPYGCGKSRLLHSIAVEAQDILGKKVLFIDTEGGLLDEHVGELKNYWYVGDSIEALEDAVASAKQHRKDYDLLICDSVGHPIYVNYVELEGMAEKLRAYQRLAIIFRDMVRFARGERNVDLGQRNALAIAANHPVSEFARVAKDLPPEEPLNPFGGQIHRVPKVILRIEPDEQTEAKSVFKVLSFKLRGFAKGVEVARFTIDSEGVKIEWKI